MLLRIAVQAKGRLYDETMSFLGESDIKLSAMKRSLLVQSSNFPLEVLFLPLCQQYSFPAHHAILHH